MFESAEVGHRIDREEYRRREPALRAALLQATCSVVERQPVAVTL